MARSSLPPGFRFHPTDVELVMYYLKRKILGKKLCVEAISEVKIYDFSPWDLPDKSCLKSKDREWFFFCPIERKYPNGGRAKRATDVGYWKATGKDRDVCYNKKVVGKIRTLVFYTGHAPKGSRTDWVMHEYRMEDKYMIDAGVQDAYVICKVFEKSGLGPKNGEQHGAPFNEEEWDEEDEETTTVDELSPPVPLPNSMIDHGQASSVISLSESGRLAPPSGAEPSLTNKVDNDDLALLLDHDELAILLDMFKEVDPSPPTLNYNDENLSHNIGEKKNMEGDNIFDDLGNLSVGGGYSTSLFASIDEALFLELDDLNTSLDNHHELG